RLGLISRVCAFTGLARKASLDRSTSAATCPSKDKRTERTIHTGESFKDKDSVHTGTGGNRVCMIGCNNLNKYLQYSFSTNPST
ncbi:hypothetical protein HispidOSU_009525, partial [Sigmodon hispidus]